MECNFPDKKCILRGTPSEPSMCRAIKKPYKGDDCKFRKESDDPVKRPKPVAKPKKVIKEEPKKEADDFSYLQTEIKERLSFVGCRLGVNWRTEEAFLKRCNDALAELNRLTQKNRWHNAMKEKPKQDCEVLLICLDKEKNDHIISGYFWNQDFIFDDGGDDCMVPVRWMEIERPRRTWA